MKVYDFIQGVKLMDNTYKTSNGRPYSENIAKDMDIWDNGACLGYLIKACQNEHIDEETTRKLLYAMQYAFDIMSVEQAYQLYENKII